MTSAAVWLTQTFLFFLCLGGGGAVWWAGYSSGAGWLLLYQATCYCHRHTSHICHICHSGGWCRVYKYHAGCSTVFALYLEFLEKQTVTRCCNNEKESFFLSQKWEQDFYQAVLTGMRSKGSKSMRDSNNIFLFEVYYTQYSMYTLN